MQVLSPTGQTSACGHGDPVPKDYTVGALFRDYGEAYIKAYQADRRAIQLIRSIRVCGTPALGGKRYRCKSCRQSWYQYFSCGNSHCPQCQGIKRLQWQDRLRSRMLGVPYCHITFTMPHILNGLARRYPKEIYNLLLRSCWQTIASLCADEGNVGGKPGLTAVLHTWGSDLKYHVHAHCLVTFGGLSSGTPAQWRWPTRKHKLARFRKLRGFFRRIFLAGLQDLMDKGVVVYHRTFGDLEIELGKKGWVVHHGRPTADTQVIEEYLGRYICRIGISNKRLHYDSNGQNVRIEYNDYRNQQSGQAAPKAYLELHPLVAMHQILQHQLPAYFQRVRYYGLHATATYEKYRDQLPDQVKKNGYTVRTIIQILKALLAQEPYQCEHCGAMDFDVIPISPDRHYLFREVLGKTASGLRPGRSPPGAANTTGQ